MYLGDSTPLAKNICFKKCPVFNFSRNINSPRNFDRIAPEHTYVHIYNITIKMNKFS